MYSLSFTEDFFMGKVQIENIQISITPNNCLQAIISWYHNDKDSFKIMVKDILGYDIDNLPEMLPYELIEKIRETDTCFDITSPVQVWLDIEGNYTINVYDDLISDNLPFM